MKENPLLDEVLALREGRSEKITTLGWLFDWAKETGQNVTVVDWICVPNFVYIVVLDNTLNPYTERLAIEVKDLRAWVSDNLTSTRRKVTLEIPEDVS